MSIDCRSALYMPASNERVLSKGPSCAADAVIVDLEDSVAVEVKSLARENAVKVLSELDYGYRLRVLRINAAGTVWYKQDIAAIAAARPDAVALPKVESDRDIRVLSDALDALPGCENIGIWAMLESPLGVLNAQLIAQSVEDCPRLSVLVVGSNDLARVAGMPISTDRHFLLPWLMMLVAAAKAYDLCILDGVRNDFSDLEAFRLECEQGAAMGMDGKSLIHPAQLAIANEVFAPSAEAIAHAKEIVTEFQKPEHATSGVLQINGLMVERLHLEMAMALLARVDRLGER